MNIQGLTTSNSELIVKLSGEMDALGCSKIRPELEKIAQTEHKQIILDLREVSFLDSSGVGAIVFLYKRLKVNNRKLSISGANGQPEELMKLLRIDSAIPVNNVSVDDLPQMSSLQKAF